MTKKQIVLLMVALVVSATWLYFHRDWFSGDTIQIYHRVSPVRFARRRPATPSGPSVLFGFDRRLKLTSIRVIPLSDIETNKYPQPIWHLISDSNSLPTKGFTYGMKVPGMRPAIEGVDPYPLEPGARYRLLVEAGSLKAQHDFEVEPTSPPPAAN